MTEPTPTPTPTAPFLVGVLYYGAVDREHDRCVQALRGHPLVLDIMTLTGCPYIDMGRSIIATHVLDRPDIGGLLFIDHDMVFDKQEATSLIESAIEADATVGAAYSMRKSGQIIGALDHTKLDPDEEILFFEGGKRFPANYLGMGMTAIPRSALERLVAASKARFARQGAIVAELSMFLSRVTQAIGLEGDPIDATRGMKLLDQLIPELRDEELPRLKTGISDAPVVPFFSHLQRRGIYYGEDVSFCVRSHLAGIGVQLDTRRRVYHKGSYCYGIEDVGMEVPYCTTLKVLDKKSPKVADADFSKSPAVRDAIAAQKSLLDSEPSTRTLDGLSPLPDEDPSTRTPDGSNGARASYPASFDPTVTAPEVA